MSDWMNLDQEYIVGCYGRFPAVLVKGRGAKEIPLRPRTKFPAARKLHLPWIPSARQTLRRVMRYTP